MSRINAELAGAGLLAAVAAFGARATPPPEPAGRVVASAGQWSGTCRDYANTLYADGKLRVDGRDVAMACRSARSARERYMTIAFDDPGR